MATIPALTSVSGSNSAVTYPPFVTRTSLLDQTNPNYARQWLLTNTGFLVLQHGSSQAAIELSAAITPLLGLVPALTWPPLITVQPANAAVVHTAGTSFSITATSEISITYVWDVSTDGGATWTAITTAGTPNYSGFTTATLTFTVSATSMNNYQYRCIATNASGSTTSNSSILTVT